MIATVRDAIPASMDDGLTVVEIAKKVDIPPVEVERAVAQLSIQGLVCCGGPRAADGSFRWHVTH